jgi:quercetin dioxygenase-like cupin family protein
VARAGDVLENPATGERLVFRETAAETGGRALEYDIWYVPKGFPVRDHLHPAQQERHEVVEGQLGLIVGGRELRLGPGDVETVPPQTRHRVFKIGDGQVHARFRLEPALETEVLLETLFGLARDGKVGASGNPGILQLAVIFSDFPDLGHPTKPPRAVQKAIFAPLAALGRLRGYKARYPEYSGAE